VISNELSDSGAELNDRQAAVCFAAELPHPRVRSTYPAMRTVLFKFLIELPAECVCLLSSALSVYAVQNVVFV
jgi:hypothetical protein